MIIPAVFQSRIRTGLQFPEETWSEIFFAELQSE